MARGNPLDVTPWVAELERLPFVHDVSVSQATGTRRVRLRAGRKTFEYRLEVRLAQPLSRAHVAPLLGTAAGRREPILLFAPHVGAGLGEALRERGIDYIDLAGNCHIDADGVHMAHVEGRRPRERFAAPGERQRAAHYGIYFALAARPELASATVREIARHAGAGKSTVDRTLARLEADGILASTSRGRRIVRRDQLIERWVAGYVEHLRRRWTVSRYRPAEKDPEKLERELARALDGKTWGLGGGAGGWRLDHHYRGSNTVVHLATPEPELPRGVRALPAGDGPLVVMVTPMPSAFASPVAEVVHPLLVYGELVASGDDRSLESAARVRQRYLTDTT